jgi:SOS-response transcriptional repressor LexA
MADLDPPSAAFLRPASLAAFGAALRARRESLGLTLDAVAAVTGISKPYLSNIETARAPGPASEEKLEKLAAALGLAAGVLTGGADWLRTPASIRQALAAAVGGGAGAGELPRRTDGAIDLDAARPAGAGGAGGAKAVGPPVRAAGEVPVRAVPLINKVAAGRPAEFTDLSYPAGVADAYVPAPDLPDPALAAAFALRVSGDSMAPAYQEGDLLIVGPATPRDGEDCVVRLDDLEGFATTFKRVYFVRDGGGDGEATAVRLVPLNPRYAERVVPVERVTGIYPVLYRLVPGRPAEASAAEPGAARAEGSFTTRVSIEHD